MGVPLFYMCHSSDKTMKWSDKREREKESERGEDSWGKNAHGMDEGCKVHEVALSGN